MDLQKKSAKCLSLNCSNRRYIHCTWQYQKAKVINKNKDLLNDIKMERKISNSRRILSFNLILRLVYTLKDKKIDNESF